MEIRDKESKISVFGANFVFLICIILLVTIGGLVQDLDFNFGILITEFVLIVVPVLIYILIKKDSVKHVLRLNTLNIIDALLVSVIFLSGYFVAVFIGAVGNIFVSLFGDLMPSPIPIATNGSEYFINILIIAGSAGICEEVLFRGLLLSAYDRIGKWKSIIFTAVLFGIMHVNIQNLFGPLFLGVILGYVVYHTNSIFAGMLGHFINNSISVSIGYALMKLPMYQNMDPEVLRAGASTPALVAAAALFGFISLFTGTIMVMCMIALKERSKHRQYPQPYESLSNILKSIRLSWPIYIGFLVFIAMIIIQVLYIAS